MSNDLMSLSRNKRDSVMLEMCLDRLLGSNSSAKGGTL